MNKQASLSIILLTGALLALSSTAKATVLAVWDFGDSSALFTTHPSYFNTAAAPVLQLSGSGLDVDGKNGIAYVDAGGIDHIAGQSAAWDDINKSGTANDAALFITLATTGYNGLAIRWDYKSELAVSFDLAYRTSAEGTWKPIADNEAITPGWSGDKWYSVAIDMAGITALDHQSYLQFRIDDLVEGPGNDKFAIDNIEITAIPEPCSLVILGVGGLLIRKRFH